MAKSKEMKRNEAAIRQAEYDKLSIEEKIMRCKGTGKQMDKLVALKKKKDDSKNKEPKK